MLIKDIVEKSGMQFFNRGGHPLNGREYWAIVKPRSPVLSMDDVSNSSFAGFYDALNLDPTRELKIGFMVVDGKGVADMDIYVVDLLEKRRYVSGLVNQLTKARNEFSFFDIETASEVRVLDLK